MSVVDQLVRYAILHGDCQGEMADMQPGCARTIVTSPPYWKLRDNGSSTDIGAEPSPVQYVENLRIIFAEARRILADDGTLWLNLGDCYAKKPVPEWGLKPKDMMGLPWRVAMALQADGWTLRSDVIWHKPNPMPTSIADRLTPAHEYLFLFAKSPTYHFDYEAILEPFADSRNGDPGGKVDRQRNRGGRTDGFTGLNGVAVKATGRRKRSVWTVSNSGKPVAPGTNIAPYPLGVPEPCILAGSAEGDLVVDPFAGAGTTGVAALRHGRRFVGMEVNDDHARLALRRLDAEAIAA